MALDFHSEDLFADPAPSACQVARGLRNYLSGHAAEEAVARDYLSRGYQILARRWRQAGGEIDLIVARGADLAIVEVKSGYSHAVAAQHLTRSQIRRLVAAAERFLFGTWLPQLAPGARPELRFDLALVDRVGRIDICEAAFFA